MYTTVSKMESKISSHFSQNRHHDSDASLNYEWMLPTDQQQEESEFFHEPERGEDLSGETELYSEEELISMYGLGEVDNSELPF